MAANKENITCPISRDKIIDFLLEELSFEETVTINDHISECKKCKEQTESLVNFFNTARSVKTPDVSSRLYFELKRKTFVKHNDDKVKIKRTGKEPYTRMLSLLLSAAAVLFFVITVNTVELPNGNGNMSISENIPWFADTILVNMMEISSPDHDSLQSGSKNINLLNSIPPLPELLTKFYSSDTDEVSSQFIRHRIKTNYSSFNTKFNPPGISSQSSSLPASYLMNYNKNIRKNIVT
ncbi:hypothetical protein ACFL7D_07005 [candidate division KSB1 bacterium]